MLSPSQGTEDNPLDSAGVVAPGKSTSGQAGAVVPVSRTSGHNLDVPARDRATPRVRRSPVRQQRLIVGCCHASEGFSPFSRAGLRARRHPHHARCLVGSRGRAGHDHHDHGTRHYDNDRPADHDDSAPHHGADDNDDPSGHDDDASPPDDDNVIEHDDDDGRQHDIELQDVGLGAPGRGHRPGGAARRPPDRP